MLSLFTRHKELVMALEETIRFLEKSEDSVWSNLSAVEVKQILETELCKIKAKQAFNKQEIKLLFFVASNIQEIAMRNGWSAEYMRIAKVIDKYTS